MMSWRRCRRWRLSCLEKQFDGNEAFLEARTLAALDGGRHERRCVGTGGTARFGQDQWAHALFQDGYSAGHTGRRAVGGCAAWLWQHLSEEENLHARRGKDPRLRALCARRSARSERQARLERGLSAARRMEGRRRGRFV